jgi:hypothetical protein
MGGRDSRSRPSEEVIVKKHTAVVAGLVTALALVGAGSAGARGSAGPCPESKACGSPQKAQGAKKDLSARPKSAPARARDPWGREGFRSGGWYME